MRDDVHLEDHRAARVRDRRRGRPPFECIACCCNAAHSAPIKRGSTRRSPNDLHPDRTAGISIGALNAAVIAGNLPEERVEKLRQFWELVTSPYPQWRTWGYGSDLTALLTGDAACTVLNQ